MNLHAWVDPLYASAIKHRNPLVKVFQLFNIAQLIILFFGYRAIVLGAGDSALYYALGKKAGEMGLLFFVLASLPGIVRRFGTFNKLISILMIFRRYIGITMYMFALLHYCLIRFFWVLANDSSLWSGAYFELAGSAAFALLFLLFITSNDWSVHRLGIWWERIHDFMYVIVWFIFLHILLQGKFDVWTLLIGVTSIAQVASHIYARLKRSR